MPSRSPQPCFTISAELHEKISRSCTPIYQDPIETVTPRWEAGNVEGIEVPAHGLRTGLLGICKVFGLFGSMRSI